MPENKKMKPESKTFRLPAKKSWLKRYIKGNEAHSSQRSLKECILRYVNEDDSNIRQNTSQKRRILQNLADNVQPSTSQKGHILRYGNGKARINTEQKKSHVLQMDDLTPNSNEVERDTSTEKMCILQRYVTDGNEIQSISIQPTHEYSTSSEDEEDKELEFMEKDEEFKFMDVPPLLSPFPPSPTPCDNQQDEDDVLVIMEEDEDLGAMEEDNELPHFSSSLPPSPKPCDNFLSSSEPVPFKSVPQFEAPSSSSSSSAKFLMKSSRSEQKPMLKRPSLTVSIDRSKLPFLSELVPIPSSVKSSQEFQQNKSLYPFEQTKVTSQSSHQVMSSVSSSGQQQLVKSPMSCQQPTVAPPTRSLEPFVVSSVSPPPVVNTPVPTSSEASLVQGEVENISFRDEWLQFSQKLKWLLSYIRNQSSTTLQQLLSSSALGPYVLPTKKILNDQTEEYVTFCYDWKKNFEPYVLIGHMYKFLPVPMSTFREVLAALTDIENGYSDDQCKDDGRENELHVMYLKNFPGLITISYNNEVIILHKNTCKKIVELSQYFNFQHNKYVICAIAAVLCIDRD